MQDYIRKIDLIIFDIDGVLIDTSKSFISTIVTTTKFYINEMLEIPVDLNNLTEADALKFKEHSGFNNDWDLTTAMVTFQLYKYRSNKPGINLDDFLNNVDTFGGGLKGVKVVIENDSNTESINLLNDKVDADLIRVTFQEFYAGEEYCESLYGFSPKYHGGNGSIKSEVILVNTELIKRWQGKTGILTGRMKNETMTAIEMIGLQDIDMDLVEFTDYVLPDKPHPDKMVKVIENAGSINALFIGDSIDDFLTTVNYNNLGLEGNLRFALVAAENDSYPDKAREFRAESVNDILEYVLNMNGN
jgi:HAD superfamily hydrolase (TIGR01548 family)